VRALVHFYNVIILNIKKIPKSSNIYLTPSFITRKLYLFRTHCERHYAGSLSWLWHKILKVDFPKLVHTWKNPKNKISSCSISYRNNLQYLSEILSRHKMLVVHQFTFICLIKLLRKYESTTCPYVFFSPGATTPIGGCILQPSSEL